MSAPEDTVVFIHLIFTRTSKISINSTNMSYKFVGSKEIPSIKREVSVTTNWVI